MPRISERNKFSAFLFFFAIILTTGDCLAPSIFANSIFGQGNRQLPPPPPAPLPPQPESAPKMGAIYPLEITIPSSSFFSNMPEEISEPQVVPLLAFQQLDITTQDEVDPSFPTSLSIVQDDEFTQELDSCNNTVLELLQTIDDIDLFRDALKEAQLEQIFNDSKLSATIFVPLDSAFQDLLDQIALPFNEFIENTQVLISFLQLHIIPSEALFVANMTRGDMYDTLLNDQSVQIGGLDRSESSLTVLSPVSATPAVIVESDFTACGSVVHLISSVLIPDLTLVLESQQTGQ